MENSQSKRKEETTAGGDTGPRCEMTLLESETMRHYQHYQILNQGGWTMTIKLPLSVTLPRKKGPGRTWVLNLNSYRNTHFQILNQAKAAYAEMVSLAVTIAGARLGASPPYHFVYTIFPGAGRSFDLANVAPIVQKFTDDALISLGIIKDDNYKIIPSIDYRFGGVDKADPRAELWIECNGEWL